MPENPVSIYYRLFLTLKITQSFSAVRQFVAKKVGYKKTYDMPPNECAWNPFVLIDGTTEYRFLVLKNDVNPKIKEI